jgi:type I restriction enzyme S subunit
VLWPCQFTFRTNLPSLSSVGAMKIVNLKNPVMASWLREQGFRLDAPPFLSGAIEARKLLEQLPVKKEPLALLTQGDLGIFHAGRIKRNWVTELEYGIPFLSSTDILQADLSSLPLISKQVITENPQLTICKDWILITRSGSIGRMAYARTDMDGMACSEHVLRVVPDPDRILPGYLYAFLSSKFGVPLVVGGTYGAIIQHIEPHHITNLPVPRLSEEIEARTHRLVREAAELRTQAARTVEEAKKQLTQVSGLRTLKSPSSPTPFCTTSVSSTHVGLRLDGFYHSRYHSDAVQVLLRGIFSAIEVRCIAESIVEPNRFKRVPVNDPTYGLPFFGTAALMRVDPEPTYYIARRQVGVEQYIVDESTLLIPRSGQLSGLIGMCVFPYGKVIHGTVTEDAIRIRCKTSVDAGYLFIALNEEHGIRQLKARAYGSSIPHLDVHQIGCVLVPKLPAKERERIGEMGAVVGKLRDTAIRLEAEARATVESAIEEAA